MTFPSKFFKRSEFACKCGCGFDTVDVELIIVLNDLRKFFDSPITINSGCRCPSHNRKVGGVPDSQHVKGRAADIVVSGVDPIKVFKYLSEKYPRQYGMKAYSTFTHIDTRSVKARW